MLSERGVRDAATSRCPHLDEVARGGAVFVDETVR